MVHQLLKRINNESDFKIKDPGDAGTIRADRFMGQCQIVTTASQTRTLAVPTRAGQMIDLSMKTDGGDCVVTVTSGYDETGSTTLTFTEAGQYAFLRAVPISTTAYRWRMVSYDGVTGPVVQLDAGAFNSIVGTDSSLGIAGQAAAQGGAVAIVGGVSATSSNAGGAVSMIGAIGTTTAVGGAATVRGGAGTGAAVGGEAKLEGGLGGSSTTVGVGGAATVTAGAGQATAAGGIASLTGGASGSGATGNGGLSKVVGGAAASVDGTGGKAQLTGGLGTGTGLGGTADVTGGAGGATGAGGQVNITGGLPTDAVGGAVVIAGAAGVGTNRAGGLASVTGGIATGTANGGAASLVSGASANGTAVSPGASGTVTVSSGAAGTATTGTGGAGGAVNITGAAGGASTGASSTGGAGSTVTSTAGAGGNSSGGSDTGGAGGSIVHVAGAGGSGATAGKSGSHFNRATNGASYFKKMAAPTAKTTNATLTVAEMLVGWITVDGAASATSTQTTPSGTALAAEFPGIAAGDCFDFTIINISTDAAETAILGFGSDITGVGSMIVDANDSGATNASGTFRFRYSGANVWVAYRIT